MSKAADMAKISARGSFHLLLGMIVSTLISSVGSIFVARLLGADQYGLYGIILSVPTLIAVFRDWGMHAAMIRFAAQFQADGRATEVRSIFLSGIIFEVAVGFLLSVISFVLSDFIAVSVFNRPGIVSLLRIAAFVPLAGGLVTAATAVFTGVEKMSQNSIMLICQSAIRTALIIGLVVLGWGTSGAIIGNLASFVAAGLIGIFLAGLLYRKLPKSTHRLEIMAYTKTMLRYSVPLSFFAVITTLLPLFYNFLLPIYYSTNNAIIGNFNIAQNFSVLITFFANPITIMLFPAFSKLDYKKDAETLKKVFQFSVKYAALLVVPVVALVMSLSEPAVSTLFGNTYDQAPLFLAVLSIIYVYLAFGSSSSVSLINSQGATNYNLKLALITAAIGFPLGYWLIMNYGVLGLLVTVLVTGIPPITGLPGIFLSLNWIKRNYNVTVDWASSAKIIFSSAAAAAPTYLLVTHLSFADWIRLGIGVVFFVLVFLIVAVLTRTITRNDLNNLREMLSTIGPIGVLVNYVFKVIEKFMSLLKM